MKAMVLEDQDRIENRPLKLRDIPDPQPGPGEIRVKVSACAICRTDLHVIEGDLLPRNLPIIPGHQVVGRVDLLGEGVEPFRLGQRVGVGWLRRTDGTCKFCKSGRENLCPDSLYNGFHADGGFAEYMTVPEEYAYELPDGTSDLEVAPFLCSGLIGYRALKRANVPKGGKLLLVGFGSSAHIVLQFALFGDCEVYVVTRSESRRNLAMKMGATWATDDARSVPVKVDSAILFAPVGDLVPATLAALERGGTLALAGIHMTDIPVLNYQKHLFHEKEIRSVDANTRADGAEMLMEASIARVKPLVRPYVLTDANVALADMKESSIDGTGVLVVEG
jgi:alcohol dehydrogenase, propanol-preferring